MTRRPGRRRRSKPASVNDFRAAPGQNPLYASRWAAAVTDAEKAKGRKLTKTEMRRLEDDLRRGIESTAVGEPADERSVTDAITAVPDPDWARVPVPAAQVQEQARRASGPQPSLNAHPRGQNPYPSGPQPTFTPRENRGRNWAVACQVRPVIYESLPALPPEPEPPAPPEPGASPALYAGPGWAGQVMSMRVSRGEWDDVQAIAEQGLGRNAAETATGFRHSRETIAGMRLRCAALGRPDLADLLLHHVEELNEAAREEAARAAENSGAQ